MNILTQFRIAVLNNAGSIGKTTMARHLLSPRMEDAGDIIYVESLNSDKETKSGMMVQGSEFDRVIRRMMESVSAIVDIGSSNIETAFQVMNEIEGSHEDLDYILIPTTSDPKQRADTINTLQNAINYGIDPEKIKVVFNKIERSENIEDSCADTIYAMKLLGVDFNPLAVVYKNSFYTRYGNVGMSMDEIFEHSIEHNKALQEKLRRTPNRTDAQTHELREINKLITLQRNAQSAIANLDLVYETLFSSDDNSSYDQTANSKDSSSKQNKPAKEKS